MLSRCQEGDPAYQRFRFPEGTFQTIPLQYLFNTSPWYTFIASQSIKPLSGKVLFSGFSLIVCVRPGVYLFYTLVVAPRDDTVDLRGV